MTAKNGFGTRSSETMRGYLAGRWPSENWAPPRTVYHRDALLQKAGCGDRGSKVFVLGAACKAVFKPYFCGTCPDCLDYSDNKLLYSLCKIADRAKGPIFVECFDLGDNTQPNLLQLAEDERWENDEVFLDEIFWEFLPKVPLQFGYRLISRASIDKPVERRREQIKYANSLGGKEGGLLLMADTLRSAVLGPVLPPSEGDDLVRGRLLLILSSMRYKPRRSTQALAEPVATFELQPERLVPYMRGVLDAGRMPIFNPYGEGEKSGKATCVRWWGCWDKQSPEEPGIGDSRSRSINGLALAYWPQVENLFPGSEFESVLRTLFNDVLPIDSIETEGLVKQYRDLLIVLFLWREAAAEYRRRVQRPVFDRDCRFWASEADIVERAIERLQDDIVEARQRANLALIDEGRLPLDWRSSLRHCLPPVAGVKVLI